MKRAIVQPADVSGVPLEELKQWLGITRDAENQQLSSLLQAGLELCEAYTGQTPLEVSCEQVFSAQNNWQQLSATPVRAITGVDQIVQDLGHGGVPRGHGIKSGQVLTHECRVRGGNGRSRF